MSFCSLSSPLIQAAYFCFLRYRSQHVPPLNTDHKWFPFLHLQRKISFLILQIFTICHQPNSLISSPIALTCSLFFSQSRNELKLPYAFLPVTLLYLLRISVLLLTTILVYLFFKAKLKSQLLFKLPFSQLQHFFFFINVWNFFLEILFALLKLAG